MRIARLVLCLVASLLFSVGVYVASAAAQGAEGEWGATGGQPAPPQQQQPGNTTIVPRSGGEDQGAAVEGTPVRLVALLTSDGQHIDQGLIWRVFETGTHNEGKTALGETSH